MVFPVPGPLAFTVANCLLRRRSRAEKTPPPPPLTRTSLPPATGPPANEDALPLAQFQDHETHFGFLYLTTRCCDLHLPYCLPSLPSASAFPRVDASSARPPHLPPARSPRCPASDPHVFLVSAASLVFDLDSVVVYALAVIFLWIDVLRTCLAHHSKIKDLWSIWYIR